VSNRVTGEYRASEMEEQRKRMMPKESFVRKMEAAF
jgi:hypothetical protein